MSSTADYHSRLEDGAGAWRHFPANKPGFGSVNSRNNRIDYNTPDSYESFILGPDEKKVEEKIDTRMPNTSYFHFNKEDHTLANLLRAKLLSSNHILFAAYRVPHPLFPTFELRVQTDGDITPKEAVIACCKDLVAELATFDREFKQEYELRKMVGQDQNAA